MSDADYIGQQFGNYIIIEPINSGTFGGVFKARHTIFADDPIIAIKIMHSHFSSQEEHALFIQEAQLLKKLKHPYILPIIDAGILLSSAPSEEMARFILTTPPAA